MGVPFLSTQPIVPMHGSGGYATTFRRAVWGDDTPNMPKTGAGGKPTAPGATTVVTPFALSTTSTEATQLAPVAAPSNPVTVGSSSTLWSAATRVFPFSARDTDWPGWSAGVVSLGPTATPLRF
jgi:hypothetical protein